jgi:imidazolonepropionase-like amidohydrolase
VIASGSLTLALATLTVGENRLALVGGKVLPCAEGAGAIDPGVVLVSDGAIEAVGPLGALAVPDAYARIDTTGRWVVPGFVDFHSHIAGGDLNDMVHPANPELRNLDNVDPDNESLRDARAGGVTTVLFIPGSGTNMSGFGTLLKTAGKSLEEMLVRFPGALKIAQAGNPERRAGDIGAGRMGMNWLIRETLRRGREYAAAWSRYERGESAEPPRLDPALENMRGLFAREFPVAVHTQIFQVVQSTRRIVHDEMGLWTVIDHSTFDGYKNAPDFAERGMAVVCGPRNFWLDRDEGRFVGIAAGWLEGGVREIGINTDAPVVAQEELSTQAAMNARFGFPVEAALRALTIVPARAAGIADRVGSIEPGKDADLVVWTGNPIDPRSWVALTLVEGRVAYDARDGRRRF